MFGRRLPVRLGVQSRICSCGEKLESRAMSGSRLLDVSVFRTTRISDEAVLESAQDVGGGAT